MEKEMLSLMCLAFAGPGPPAPCPGMLGVPLSRELEARVPSAADEHSSLFPQQPQLARLVQVLSRYAGGLAAVTR